MLNTIDQKRRQTGGLQQTVLISPIGERSIRFLLQVYVQHGVPLQVLHAVAFDQMCPE